MQKQTNFSILCFLYPQSVKPSSNNTAAELCAINIESRKRKQQNSGNLTFRTQDLTGAKNCTCFKNTTLNPECAGGQITKCLTGGFYLFFLLTEPELIFPQTGKCIATFFIFYFFDENHRLNEPRPKREHIFDAAPLSS